MAIISTHKASRGRSFNGLVRDKVRIDFGETPYSAGDRIKLFDVYPKDRVLDLFSDVITPEGGVATGEVGDFTTDDNAVDSDGYINDLNLNAAAQNNCTGAYAATGGKSYTANSYIALTLDHAVDAGVVEFEVLLAPATD